MHGACAFQPFDLRGLLDFLFGDGVLLEYHFFDQFHCPFILADPEEEVCGAKRVYNGIG
jgi:hypothetical protein